MKTPAVPADWPWSKALLPCGGTDRPGLEFF